MPKVFYCSKCTGEHARPVGKKCQRDIAGESFSSADEVAVPPSPSSEITVSDQILRQLRVLGDKMDSMDKRVQRTEAALEQGSSQASLHHSSSHKSSNSATVSHGSDTASNLAESVVPSMEYLRSNESLQSEVEKCLADLKNLNEAATRGRVKSQRGGPGEITVKKSVDWPQNFILTGTHKTRPTYDDLSITQWVSGFVRCIQEEKSENTKASMLDYLGNIMEDASDFSWDSAKACHAILLTNMEADRISWNETEKIDRIRRAHAQRHVTATGTSATRSFTKKSKNIQSKSGLNCKYFQEGTCRYPSHHRSAGQFYRHVCETCDGLHMTKNCSQKSNSKN